MNQWLWTTHLFNRPLSRYFFGHKADATFCSGFPVQSNVVSGPKVMCIAYLIERITPFQHKSVVSELRFTTYIAYSQVQILYIINIKRFH